MAVVEALAVVAGVRVDTHHEILVKKLCASSRVRSFGSRRLRALVWAGGDFDRALEHAPKKDGGLSPMTLAWLLDQLSLRPA